ncbi:MAG: hypothetical protein JNJ60_07260, partial [Rhodocyclaceae bacterium]|nr:hypothetical protein [Rhodocyclaceae bacterium]
MKRALALSVADQALLSAFNFGLNLYLIRAWPPEQFGFFAVLAAAGIFAAMLQNALVNTPLAVHLPVAPGSAERALLRRAFGSANLLLTALVLVLAWALAELSLGGGQALLAALAALHAAAQFLREYYRSRLAVDAHLGALLWSDLAYLLLACGALGAIEYLALPAQQALPLLLGALAGAALLSVAPHWRPPHPAAWPALPRELRQVFGAQMHEIRWSLAGVITTDIQNRGYIFVAAAVFGPAAVAHLQAGRLFFGPLNLLSGAWARVARPRLAQCAGQGDQAAFAALLRQAVLLFAALNAAFLGALWLAWPLLAQHVFGDKYRDMGPLIAAWGLANLLFQVRSCLATGVQALRRFRDLTMATLYGALLSALLLAAVCAAAWERGLIASVIAGECVALAVVAAILR